MIFFGTVLGGPEVEGGPMSGAIRRLVAAKKKFPVPTNPRPSGIDIEFQFYVPGSVFRPDFEGVRVGRFSRKLNRLMIQVGVPAELGDPNAWLREHVSEGLVAADAHLRKRRLSFDVRIAEEEMDTLLKLAALPP